VKASELASPSASGSVLASLSGSEFLSELVMAWALLTVSVCRLEFASESLSAMELQLVSVC
jgi:hypothetical protein